MSGFRHGLGPKPTVSDDEILAVFRESTDTVLTASEVAQDFPIGRHAVHNRLQQLADKEVLQSKDTGSGSRVWWLTGLTSIDKG